MLGVDPHKGSHTAVVIDPHEAVLGQVRVRAWRHGQPAPTRTRHTPAQ